MIVNFKTGNFRSIKEEVELSFEASSIQNLNQNVINANLVSEKTILLLKTISLYGPNASGKSNLIKALEFMKSLILNSININKGDYIPFNPFKLDQNYENHPSFFEVELVLNSIHYIYGFKSTEKIINSEYLYYYPNGKKSIIFERNNNRNSSENDISDYKFTVDKSRQELYASMTSTNKLYLSVSTNLENTLTAPVFNWFKDKLIIHTTEGNKTWSEYTTHLIKLNDQNEKIVNFLKGADFNINRLIAREKKTDMDADVLSKISTIVKEDALNSFISSKFFEVKTLRSGVDQNGNPVDVLFDMTEESDGTNKFFELAGPFIDMLAHGDCLVFDELDTRLHPNLLVFLVTLFNKNMTNAQLLFTAHNTVVLDQKYMRRDQIYFTNRKNDGSSELYSVYDFQEEKVTSNLN